ncbi:MAG: OmpA family protein [Myxococcota bacterium]|nr:OmpA family protein [Myxococcota bacterium]
MKVAGLLLATALTLAPACVRSSTHRAKVATLTAEHDATRQRERGLQDQLAKAALRIAALEAEQVALERQVEVGSAMASEFEDRLKKLGQSVESLNREKVATTARLEELRRQKAAAEERAATFRNLVAKFRQMIDSGQLKVVVRDGRMIIALPNDILFDSGSTGVKKDGKAAIAKVAQVLATVADRRFLVAGHTDNVPIRTAQFASNWELSTARAVEVVQLLVKSGMSPKALSAAGFSEFDPVAANDTPTNKALNRRIEIVLQPNLADLPPLDDIGK